MRLRGVGGQEEAARREEGAGRRWSQQSESSKERGGRERAGGEEWCQEKIGVRERVGGSNKTGLFYQRLELGALICEMQLSPRHGRSRISQTCSRSRSDKALFCLSRAAFLLVRTIVCLVQNVLGPDFAHECFQQTTSAPRNALARCCNPQCSPHDQGPQRPGRVGESLVVCVLSDQVRLLWLTVPLK